MLFNRVRSLQNKANVFASLTIRNFSACNIQRKNWDILNNVQADTFEDRAFGSILGGFCADACGSYLEGNSKIASEELMDKCMEMPGGGPLETGKGQITDDSELAMC